MGKYGGNYKYKEDVIQDVIAKTNTMLQLGLLLINAVPEKIYTNDIKKGDIILEFSDQVHEWWVGEMWDNMKGVTRVVNVYGWEEEAGSVYSHEIMAVWKNGEWVEVTHTDAQKKCKENVRVMFGE